MPMVRNQFPYQMDKVIDDMFMDRLEDYPSEYEQVAKIENFPKGRYYTAAEISGLGDVRLISEGGRVEFDTPVEGHRKQVEAVKYGLGFQVTEEMVDDDFHDKISQVAGTLAESAKEKVNIEFFSLFNDGNDTHTAWDSAYIFADAHTTLKSGDTIDNLGASALSETTFQAAKEYFDGLVNEAGRKAYVRPDMLLVPTELQWMANRLQMQTGAISTSGVVPDMSGNLNTANPSNGFVDPWKVFVSRYLTDAETWFLLSSKDHQMKLLWKKQITLESSDDFHTGARMYKVTMRFYPACFDYKPVYGAFV
jgi:hypothetical protein